MLRADFCSESMIAGWKEDKTNSLTVDQQLDSYIALYNQCIEKHIDKMHIGLHICRGMKDCSLGLWSSLTN